MPTLSSGVYRDLPLISALLSVLSHLKPSMNLRPTSRAFSSGNSPAPLRAGGPEAPGTLPSGGVGPSFLWALCHSHGCSFLGDLDGPDMLAKLSVFQEDSRMLRPQAYWGVTTSGAEDRHLWGRLPLHLSSALPCSGSSGSGSMPRPAHLTLAWPRSCPIPMQEPCSLVPFCCRTRMGLNSGSTAYYLCDPGEGSWPPEPPA